MGAASMIVLIISALLFAGGGIVGSMILNKGSKNEAKGQPYECGVETIGGTWIQFSVGYYLFALIFLVFDVELVFMYPWAAVVKEVGMPALFEILVFMFILFMGLLYAWKKGALEWK